MAADGVRMMRTWLIPPLNAGGRAEEVAQKVGNAVLLGLMADGEQLPSEVEFAGQLGVSPMTLREALATLREQGLVETRRGRSGGTFVRRQADPPLAPLRRRLREATATGLRDLADEQFAVSGTSARLAAERASAVNQRRLIQLVEQLENAKEYGDRIRADSRFHIELAIASQSERLTRLEVGLQAEMTPLLWLPGGPETMAQDAVAEHHAIALAVAEEDPDRARALTERHVERNLRRLIASHLAMVQDRPRSAPHAS